VKLCSGWRDVLANPFRQEIGIAAEHRLATSCGDSGFSFTLAPQPAMRPSNRRDAART
jgi:hypothetical protein